MSVEKFKGSFTKEDSGCTILINQTILSIKDPAVLGLYCYLLSKPSGWIINPKEIMAHFNSCKDKVYRLLNTLIDLRLLTKSRIHKNGKFFGYDYLLHLKPCADTEELQNPEKQDTENQDTYKTYIYTKQKEKEKNIIKKEKADSVFDDNPHDIPQPLLDEWKEVRRAKRAPITPTAWKRLNNELAKCNCSKVEAFEEMLARGWTTVKADWINRQKPPEPTDPNDTSWAEGIGKGLLG